MTETSTLHRATFECVDNNPESLPEVLAMMAVPSFIILKLITATVYPVHLTWREGKLLVLYAHGR